MSQKGQKLLYTRVGADPVLKAVMADIHMQAVQADKGFMTRAQWAAKWNLAANHQASLYVDRAVKIGVLVKKRFRVITKGRMRLLDHFGPPPASTKRKAS
jgi:hypothetical protein